MTKEIKIKDNTYLFVEVPDDAIAWSIKYHMDGTKRSLRVSSLNDNYELCVLEKECFEIISTIKNITKEQTESIVEKYTNYETEHEQLLDGMYEDYLKKGNYWVQDNSGIKLWAFKTAKESLQSLIQANKLDINKNYLILKKNDIK